MTLPEEICRIIREQAERDAVYDDVPLTAIHFCYTQTLS